MKSKQLPTSKVVPFTGELYTQPDPTTPHDNTASYLVIVAAALIGGLALGAIATYQSTDQVKFREMKQQSEQLQQVKTQVCK